MSSVGDHDPRANFIASESLSFPSLSLPLSVYFDTRPISLRRSRRSHSPSFRSFPLRLSGTEIESGPAAKFTMTLLPFARSRCACSLPSPPLWRLSLLSGMSDQFGIWLLPVELKQSSPLSLRPPSRLICEIATPLYCSL